MKTLLHGFSPLLRLFWLGSFCVLLPLSNFAGDGSLRWKFTTLSSATPGAILSSPSVGPEGNIYFGLEIGDAASASPAGRLLCLRPDGSLYWLYECGDWVDSAPLVTLQGDVVFGCWDGFLRCLTPQGALKWSVDVGAFVAGSAAQAPDGTLYVGSGAGVLSALDAEGRLLWRFYTADWIMATPAVGSDGTIYVASADRTLYAVSPSGTEKWRYVAGDDIVSSPSIAADGTLFFGCRDNAVRALSAEGALLWSFTCADVVDSSVTLGSSGTLHFSSADGHVYSLDKYGTERWRYPAAGQAALQGFFSTPAVRGDDSVLVGSGDGSLLCLNANGTLRWSAAMGDWADSSVLVTPVGTLYIGCQDKGLYSFEGTVSPRFDDWGQYARTPQRGGWQPMGLNTQASGRISNMSVRVPLAAGQRVSVGTWLNGTGQRELLVRAVGPGLAAFGVSPVLPDPFMGLYRQGVFLSANDNWQQAANVEALQAAMLANTGFQLADGSLDAAALRSFFSGGHTFEVEDSATGAGVCLVELYDLGGDPTARISNISARTQVGTGDAVLVPGFYLADGPRSLLLRGIGPGLAPFLPGETLLPVPRLRVFQGTREIVSVAAWNASSNPAQLEALMAAVYAFSLSPDSSDAVVVVSLPAGGPYTAVLDGVGGATGMGLVEVYVVE